jgi:hypothetical protein
MQLTYAVGLASPTNLWQVIQDFTVNNETTFISEIPNFIEIAENRIYQSVQIPAIRKNQTSAMTAGFQYLTLPPDYIYTYSLATTDPFTHNQTFLVDKDVNFIRAAYPAVTTLSSPQYYAQFDYQTLIVGPTPDQSYTVELHYGYLPISIVTAGNTWLGNNFADVLLYGALREAYIFMKGEADVIQMYEGKYQESLMLLKQTGDGKLRQDSFRSGQVRVPIK